MKLTAIGYGLVRNNCPAQSFTAKQKKMWLPYFIEQARNADVVLYAYITEQYDLTALSGQFTKPLAVQITLTTM